jgi:hypothetical protein
MTGADGGAGPGVRPGWQRDVALSFAGARRGYAGQVAGGRVRPAGLGEAAALAAAPAPRTVVWLDGLPRYLGGECGLTGGVVAAG